MRVWVPPFEENYVLCLLPPLPLSFLLCLVHALWFHFLLTAVRGPFSRPSNEQLPWAKHTQFVNFMQRCSSLHIRISASKPLHSYQLHQRPQSQILNLKHLFRRNALSSCIKTRHLLVKSGSSLSVTNKLASLGSPVKNEIRSSRCSCAFDQRPSHCPGFCQFGHCARLLSVKHYMP